MFEFTKVMKDYEKLGGMPAKNNPNLGLAACF